MRYGLLIISSHALVSQAWHYKHLGHIDMSGILGRHGIQWAMDLICILYIYIYTQSWSYIISIFVTLIVLNVFITYGVFLIMGSANERRQTLLCNVVSQWLCPFPEWSLNIIYLYWKWKVVMMPTFSSLLLPQVVIMTVYNITSDGEFGVMTTDSFQFSYFYQDWLTGITGMERLSGCLPWSSLDIV